MDRWDDFRSPLDLGDWSTVERRIGVRVPAPGLAVWWVLPGDVEGGGENFTGRIIEVSVTGAAVSSAPVPITLPCRVSLRYGDSDSLVTVRHESPTDLPGITVYGVEWSRLEEPLRQSVYDLVAGGPAVAPGR